MKSVIVVNISDEEGLKKIFPEDEIDLKVHVRDAVLKGFVQKYICGILDKEFEKLIFDLVDTHMRDKYAWGSHRKDLTIKKFYDNFAGWIDHVIGEEVKDMMIEHAKKINDPKIITNYVENEFRKQLVERIAPEVRRVADSVGAETTRAIYNAITSKLNSIKRKIKVIEKCKEDNKDG